MNLRYPTGDVRSGLPDIDRPMGCPVVLDPTPARRFPLGGCPAVTVV